MNKSKFKIVLFLLIFTFSTQITVFAEPWNNGGHNEGGIPPTGNTGNANNENNNNSKPGGNGGSDASNNKPSHSPGSINNPYIKKISVPSYLQYNTHILAKFNSLANGEGNARVTAYDFTRTNGKSHVSKIVDSNGDETYVKWLYPVVTVTRTTTNKIKETSRKNDYFNWVATGPENWTVKTDSNRLTHTFTKVGKYKIVYTPHQLITTSHQNFTNTKAVAYYPSNGSSTTLLSKDTTGALTTKVEGVWRMDYRQVWEFEITAADVGKPIPIGPNTPPTNEIINEKTHPELWESETQLIQ